MLKHSTGEGGRAPVGGAGMTAAELAAARRAFTGYLARFDRSDPRIAHKADHSLRVSGVAARLAGAAGCPAEDVYLAELIGLVHDIGRFTQHVRYGTFRDRDSVDHADLGCRLLFDEGQMRLFLPRPDLDGIIAAAVAGHNKLRLPDGLDGRTLLHARLIRDADKVDNLYIKQTEPFTELFGVEDISRGPISPEITARLYACAPIPHDMVHTPLDNWLKYLAFIFDMYFAQSLDIVRRGRYLDNMAARVMDGPCREELGAILAHLNGYLAEKSGACM